MMGRGISTCARSSAGGQTEGRGVYHYEGTGYKHPREEQRWRPDGAALPRRGLILGDPHAPAVAQMHDVVRRCLLTVVYPLLTSSAAMVRRCLGCVGRGDGAIMGGVGWVWPQGRVAEAGVGAPTAHLEDLPPRLAPAILVVLLAEQAAVLQPRRDLLVAPALRGDARHRLRTRLGGLLVVPRLSCDVEPRRSKRRLEARVDARLAAPARVRTPSWAHAMTPAPPVPP